MVGVRGSCRATSFRSMLGMCAYVVAWWLAPCLETTGNGRAAATCDFACQLKRYNYTHAPQVSAHAWRSRVFPNAKYAHELTWGVCKCISSHVVGWRAKSIVLAPWPFPVASKHQLLPGGNHICTCTRGASPSSGCYDTSCDAASRGDGDCKALKWRAARGGPCHLPDHLGAGCHGSALRFGCVNHIE